MYTYLHIQSVCTSINLTFQNNIMYTTYTLLEGIPFVIVSMIITYLALCPSVYKPCHRSVSEAYLDLLQGVMLFLCVLVALFPCFQSTYLFCLSMYYLPLNGCVIPQWCKSKTEITLFFIFILLSKKIYKNMPFIYRNEIYLDMLYSLDLTSISFQW